MRELRRIPFLESYDRSMKAGGMDGPIDLFIYRPIGFLIAWGLSFTKIGPNSVTLCGIILGFAAGACALPGTTSAFLLCALLFQASNCCDCADGQLARLTGRYSREGRLLDGAADYAVNLFVYLGCMAGLVRSGEGLAHAFVLVAAGGLAMAFSCLYYDRAITRHARLVEGRDEGEECEIAEARESAEASRGAARLLWRTYALYLKLQRESWGRGAAHQAPLGSEASRKAYDERMRPLLMAWSFTGPSAHVLCFLVFAALGRIEGFFVASVLVGLATAALIAVRQLVDSRLADKALAGD
jgi:phosphatidylglycerophosphate synthase